MYAWGLEAVYVRDRTRPDKTLGSQRNSIFKIFLRKSIKIISVCPINIMKLVKGFHMYLIDKGQGSDLQTGKEEKLCV